MAAITVPAAFKNLVKLLANMFYGSACPPPWWVDKADPKKAEAQDPELAMFEQEKKAAQLAREAKRKAQQDTTGLGVILLTALTEHQWVEEDEFARGLNLPAKMVRRAMRFLEHEHLVQREHRKESVRARKKERDLQIRAGLRPGPGGSTAAAAQAAAGGPAAAAAGGEQGEEEEEAITSKGHTITYCALDYPRIVDSVRLRLATIKRNLAKEVRNNHAVQRYKCPHPKCGKEFSSMDVFQLMPSAAAGSRELTCSICGSEIVMVLDEGGTELGSMEDKKERQRKARALLDGMDAALAPLTAQLSAIEGLSPPDFNNYPNWLLQQVALKQRLDSIAAQAAQGNAGSSKRASAAAPAFDSNMQVVINFAERTSSDGLPGAPAAAAAAASAGSRVAAGSSSGANAAGSSGAKLLPPWMTKHTAAAQQQQQALAAKPIPPWLMSAQRQSASAAAGAPPPLQQQAGSSSGFGLAGAGLKAEGGLKPEPGLKLEGFKPEPGIKDEPGFKQEDADGLDGELWEDVPAGLGNATAGDASAAGTNQPASLGGAVLDAAMDEEEDWEDV